MTSGERLQTVLQHKQADKIVVDFGSTAVTGIHVSTVENLRNYYGLEKRPVKVVEPYQMLGGIDDDLAEIMEIDVIGLSPRNNLFGFENKNWKEFRTFWGQEVLVPENFNTKLDQKGDLLIYPEGDTTSDPSGRMPQSGYFFDTIIRQPLIDEAKLNPEDNLEEFSYISDEDVEYWKINIQNISGSEKGIMANFGGTAFGDIALVPAPFLKNPKGIRDVTEWYISTVARTDYIHAIFEKQAEIALANLTKLAEIAGDKVDVVFICGADFGTQDSLFCSPETFNELYKPYYLKINDWIHQNTSWKTFKHSCGAVYNLIPNFIESGFDILNPVQINAAGMDPARLKEMFGDKIVFWGGGVDTQKMLPFGKPEEVEYQVMKQCEILGKNGGFVFNTVHNAQAKIPVENMVAMINAIKKFNGLYSG